MKARLTTAAAGLLAGLFLMPFAQADDGPQRIGLSKTYPEKFADWQNAFLA